MKKSRLIEILEDKLSDDPISLIESGKSIYFLNKLTGNLDFKCCPNEKESFIVGKLKNLNLEIDDCHWYFSIYEGVDHHQHQVYFIPNDNSETYIEMFLERYRDYLDKKYKLDESLSELRKLRSSNILDEIRDYKLNKLSIK